MNNPVKLVIGALIGAGVGAAIARAAGIGAGQETDGAGADPARTRESLRERLERARSVGEAARLQKEDELRAHFRAKVKDQQALRENPTL
ncbi:MAG TPA: hypothetical protein VMM78_05545 [Thermomicrobiales bacterium]|nr:hypothetical protein [Thermomicrobiales bacterium]